MALFQSVYSGTNMGGAGIRKGLIDWFVAVLFCVGLTCVEGVESHVSERLQIPERSLLQSGRKVASLSIRLDIQSSVYSGTWEVSVGMPGKKVEIQFDQICFEMAG